MPTTFSQTSGEGDPVPVDEINDADDGDDSKLIVDQAIPICAGCGESRKAVFLILWFHTPHKPIVDPDLSSGVNSSGSCRDSIEDMDKALGRMRDELGNLGIQEIRCYGLPVTMVLKMELIRPMKRAPLALSDQGGS